MHITKGAINGHPNVGLFGFVTHGQFLCGAKLRTKQRKLFEEVLGAKYRRVRIAGTDLPGVMLVGNSKRMLIPGIVFDMEIDIIDQAEIPYAIFNTQLTCLGNNIVCNDDGAVVSTEFSEGEVKKISELLGVPVAQSDIAGLTTPGAVIVVHGTKAIIHKDASEAEVKLVEKTLKVDVSPATVNLGGSHLRAGILN
ncbi:translation initiation factor IF-6, partial [Candidatus Woesearchaeota archaeon]|nr:translation initiation factor IF-6 [Candidatus Woesearchaeota archaeon]